MSYIAPHQQTIASTPAGNEHILVVEDDELVLQMVIVLLESLGYQVTAVDCASKALQMLSSGIKVDLLFSDIVMPGEINGIELAENIKQLYPNIPVLLTSGYTEIAATSGHMLPHGTLMISKPYRRTNLAIKLREILD